MSNETENVFNRQLPPARFPSRYTAFSKNSRLFTIRLSLAPGAHLTSWAHLTAILYTLVFNQYHILHSELQLEVSWDEEE